MIHFTKWIKENFTTKEVGAKGFWEQEEKKENFEMKELEEFIEASSIGYEDEEVFSTRVTTSKSTMLSIDSREDLSVKVGDYCAIIMRN
jgi:hypothetical protein